MTILKKIGLAALAILLVAQFFRPEENNGDLSSVSAFLEETKPPENVQKILKETCFDCHSSKTNYPWYNNITPLNYWLDDHIKDGKKHLDFSNWNAYTLKRKEHKMDELHEEVAAKKMPLESYTYTHAEANLTQEQIDAVVTWGKKTQAGYKELMNN